MNSHWKLAQVVLLLVSVSQSYGASPRALIAEPNSVGSVNTEIEKVPYLVSIETLRIHACSGAIISNKHVLTTCECLAAGPPIDDKMYLWFTRIRAGSTTQVPVFNLFGGVIHQIASKKFHPQSSLYSVNYNLAVVTVTNKFVFTPRVQAISVPTQGESFIDYNQNATASGWGRTKPDGSFSPIYLRKAEIPFIPREVCQKYSGIYRITKRTLCSAGAFMNDPGSPLVHKNGLIGVSAWGMPRENNSLLLHVYSNLLDDELRTFIKEETGL